MSDCEIITLSLCQEALGIDSENLFWSMIKSDYKQDFPNLIHLTLYNIRRKTLAPYIHLINQRISADLNFGEDVFVVDSMPIPICKNAREKRLKVCKENFETAPDKGYSAFNKQYFIGYKLHLMASLNGVFFSMDITKASVHNVQYLSDIRYSRINNATILAGAGYISSNHQIDFFTSAKISLQAPY